MPVIERCPECDRPVREAMVPKAEALAWLNRVQTDLERAEEEVERLRPIVAHVAGLVVQDSRGYSPVYLSLIRAARQAINAR